MTPSSCITAHDHEEEALTGGNIVHNALKYPEANAFKRNLDGPPMSINTHPAALKPDSFKELDTWTRRTPKSPTEPCLPASGPQNTYLAL